MSITRYASFALVFGPLLGLYFFPGTSTALETVFMFVNGLLFAYYNRNRYIVWPRYYPWFFAYALAVPVLGWVYYGNLSTVKSSYISILLYTFCFIQYAPLLRYRYIKRYYRILVTVCCAFFLLQEVMFALLGWRISGILPILPVRYEYISTAEFIQNQMVAARSQSLFLEPAHFAQYMLGYLAIVLGEACNRRRLIDRSGIALSLVLLFTWSGNAIVLTALLWIAFFFSIRLNRVVKYGVILPALALVVSGFLLLLSTTEKGSRLLQRTDELSTEQTRLSSGAIRIYRGYLVYSSMSLPEQVTGVGSGVATDAIEHSPYGWMFYDFERYLNNVQTLLVGYGGIGLLLFILFLWPMLRCNNHVARFCIVLFIGLSFIESFWGSVKMLLYLSIPFLLYKESLMKKYEKSNVCLRHPA